MKGFFRRDLYHLARNGGFYLAFLGIMVAAAALADFNATFLYLYVMIFAASALLGLFSYDTANRWQAYAAAAPNGRRAQVDSRYGLALLVCGGVTGLLAAVSLLGKKAGSPGLALIFGGMLFLHTDLVFPLSYRFENRSRLVTLIILAAIAGGMSVGGSMLVLTSGSEEAAEVLAVAGAPLFAAGVLGMALSHRISVAIMAKKEL